MFRLQSHCHILFCTCGTFLNMSSGYKLLITFQRVDVYLNEPIEIGELIKLTNQSNYQIKSTFVIERAKITTILIFESKR